MRIILIGCSGQQLGAELSKVGHDIVTLWEGSDVSAVAVDFDPEVIWIDASLPDAATLELAAQIRHEPRLRHVTLVKHSETPWEEGDLSSLIDLCITRQSFVETCRTSNPSDDKSDVGETVRPLRAAPRIPARGARL